MKFKFLASLAGFSSAYNYNSFDASDGKLTANFLHEMKCCTAQFRVGLLSVHSGWMHI